MNMKVLQLNKPGRFQENAGMSRQKKNWLDWKNREIKKVETNSKVPLFWLGHIPVS